MKVILLLSALAAAAYAQVWVLSLVIAPNSQSLANRPRDLHFTGSSIPVWRLPRRWGTEKALPQRKCLPSPPYQLFVIPLTLSPLV